MRKLAPILIAMVLHGVLTAPSASACTCEPGSAQELFERARAVFTGTATEVRDDRAVTVATIRTTAVYKGTVELIEDVTTASTAAACGVAFATGTEYAIFAVPGPGALRTTSCSGTSIGTGEVGDLAAVARYPDSTTSPLAADLPDPTGAGRSGPIAAALLLMGATAGGHAARWRHNARA